MKTSRHFCAQNLLNIYIKEKGFREKFQRKINEEGYFRSNKFLINLTPFYLIQSQESIRL
jgi:hypothetical protein